MVERIPLNNIKIILIANYSKDNQESMNRFAQVLYDKLKEDCHEIEIWRPIYLFGFFIKSNHSNLGKYLAYIDKYVFSFVIFFIRAKLQLLIYPKIVFHICDHSNAVYIKLFGVNRTLITCHDVLAIKGAFGHKDAYCQSSKFGKLLQKWILFNLSRANHIASVSINTRKQLENLTNRQYLKVIHNGLNAPFRLLKSNEIAELRHLVPKGKYLLHVGSNLHRKNRSLLIKLLNEFGADFDGVLCLAGKGPDEQLKAQIILAGLENKVLIIEKPSHEYLNLLYNCCEAFIFPSFSEGFGWPIIEAQACGAPVICSNINPFIEITHGSALLANPHDVIEFKNQLLQLDNISYRNKLIANGISNSRNYTIEKMVGAYKNYYEEILN